MKREIDWKLTPLVPGIVQDECSKNVLMLGYLNQESYEATQRTGLVTFFSRSRGRLWQKGEESGNVLKVKNISVDCDSDTILFQVNPAGPTCHTLTPSCFHSNELNVLEHIVESKQNDSPEVSYTASLLQGERKNLLKKVGEEATEVVVALALQEKSEVTEEIADLIFHLTVAMRIREVKWNDVFDVLAKRRRLNGPIKEIFKTLKKDS